MENSSSGLSLIYCFNLLTSTQFKAPVNDSGLLISTFHQFLCTPLDFPPRLGKLNGLRRWSTVRNFFMSGNKRINKFRCKRCSLRLSIIHFRVLHLICIIDWTRIMCFNVNILYKAVGSVSATIFSIRKVRSTDLGLVLFTFVLVPQCGTKVTALSDPITISGLLHLSSSSRLRTFDLYERRVQHRTERIKIFLAVCSVLRCWATSSDVLLASNAGGFVS